MRKFKKSVDDRATKHVDMKVDVDGDRYMGGGDDGKNNYWNN